jgi:tRNA pseudouridine38-40 synthase
MRRIKLTLAYDGTEFHGWQVQPGLLTIQGILEAIFAGIEKAPVHVAGSGRTDAGVHALAQVAAVSLRNPIPLLNLRKAVNRLLPPAIRLLHVEEVPEAFHPRYDAVCKTYEYRIHRGEICSPFERRHVHHHPYPMDDELFIEHAPLFEGEHDFSAFAAADDRDSLGHSKVRRIFTSRAERSGDRLTYRISGNGFLKHMVRNIAGTLLETGKRNLAADDLRGLLANPTRKAGPRAPAAGLFLVSVDYQFG